MKTQKQIIKIFILFFLFCQVSELFATGVLHVRPRGSSNPYEKVWIKSLDINTKIQDQVAVTHVDQVFYNELNSSVEAIYMFPLPENAMVTELVYWVNGERFVAEIKERQQAIAEYNEKLRQWLDPALLEYLGDNLFRLSIVPINALTEFRSEITYIELLNYDFGVSNYTYLMNTLQLSSQPLQTVHFNLEARTQNAYKLFESPSHALSAATQLTKHDDYHYSLDFGDENFYPDKDLTIEFETLRSGVEFSLLTYSPVPSDSFGTSNFYNLWITPPDSVSDDDLISKDIIFTADVSSSMEGERLSQVKQSLDSFLDKLKIQDRFNIITFATHVVKFKDDLVEANEVNISAARTFVDEMYALGLTNISEALDSSFAQSFNPTSSKNLIFLTDGAPTYGQTLTDSIIIQASQNNNNQVRLFSFGVGETINRALLAQLSTDNYGYATFIASDDSIALLIDNHFTRISKPVMTNLKLNFDNLQVVDSYPKNQLDLYWGSQLLETGLYNGSGDFSVTLSGWIGEDSVSYTKLVTFSDTLKTYRFVPRLWAQSKINFLLNQIEIHGEIQELIDQVIELSLTYQILTPYTALYVDPDPDVTDIDDTEKIVPGAFKLYANYPNPFNPETTIKYSLPAGQSVYNVKVKIYNALGQLIEVLVESNQKPGLYTIKWNASNVPSGIYFCRIEAGQFNATQKMLLVR